MTSTDSASPPPATPAATAVPVLETRALVQAYDDPITQVEKVVLDRIDLVVRAGEFVCVVGPSGCGKTRLLNLIGGFERAHSGECLIDGRPVSHPDRDRGIVTQHYSLFPHLTVLDNVALGLDLEEYTLPGRWLYPIAYRRARKLHRAQAQEYLKKVGLAEHAPKHPHQLSGGMRQRVAIAQAMIMKPRILLMDEPFGALDTAVRAELQWLMIETHEREKNTIFFVTHDLEEAVFLGTRVICLSPYAADGSRLPGARIALDVAVPEYDKPDARSSPEHCALVQEIRAKGFGLAAKAQPPGQV